MLEQTYRNKKVFLTGHTGFKGAWLALWLHALGAKVTGYALQPPTEPSLFKLCGIGDLVHSLAGDVRDASSLQWALREAAPEVVIHMAAQAIVRDSYRDPLETFGVNVMGTVNLLEAVRLQPGIRAVVVVTTDKCYENREWMWGYRENEPLGGHDPYSSSKACAELVTASYRRSFFSAPGSLRASAPAIATARAGNVIGGGDWARDRLIPDCIRAAVARETLKVRHPLAVRPWQHVLEPLAGYLLLAKRLVEEGDVFAEAWNFGPAEEDARPVGWIVERVAQEISGFAWQKEEGAQPHEANVLRLDSAKARARLGWKPYWTLDTALEKTLLWYEAWRQGKELQAFSLNQIEEYGSCLKGD